MEQCFIALPSVLIRNLYSKIQTDLSTCLKMKRIAKDLLKMLNIRCTRVTNAELE